MISGAREQAFTLKRNASHMILWWQIEEFVLSFISLIPKKKIIMKVWSFIKVKDHHLVWTKILFCWMINFPINKDNVDLLFAKFKMARGSV
jgi:hypothetical protein